MPHKVGKNEKGQTLEIDLDAERWVKPSKAKVAEVIGFRIQIARDPEEVQQEAPGLHLCGDLHGDQVERV